MSAAPDPAPIIAAATRSDSALVSAADWTALTLSGSLATTVAIIAVAILGLTLLTGRLAIAQAARTVLGIAILFGAASIAQALVALGSGAAGGSGYVGERGTYDAPDATYENAPDDAYGGASLVR